jgi:hypothetical protein
MEPANSSISRLSEQLPNLHCYRWIVLGLLFDPEDGYNTFVRNVG